MLGELLLRVQYRYTLTVSDTEICAAGCIHRGTSGGVIFAQQEHPKGCKAVVRGAGILSLSTPRVTRTP